MIQYLVCFCLQYIYGTALNIILVLGSTVHRLTRHLVSEGHLLGRVYDVCMGMSSALAADSYFCFYHRCGSASALARMLLLSSLALLFLRGCVGCMTKKWAVPGTFPTVSPRQVCNRQTTDSSRRREYLPLFFFLPLTPGGRWHFLAWLL